MDLREHWERRKKNRRRLKACRDLLNLAKGEIRPAAEAVTPRSGMQTLILVFDSVCVSTMEALLLLARKGHREQGAMLARSLFEHMVDAHWAVNNPQIAEDNLRDYETLSRVLLWEMAQNHPNIVGTHPPLSVAPAEVARLKGKFGKHGTRGWSNKNLFDRTENIKPLWPDQTSRETLEFFRDIPLKLNNQFLHPSPYALGRHLSEPDPEDLVPPEVEAFWSYHQMLGLITDEFNLSQADDWHKRINDLFHRGFSSSGRKPES
jgi:uncharacterized protein DUF5677